MSQVYQLNNYGKILVLILIGSLNWVLVLIMTKVFRIAGYAEKWCKMFRNLTTN